MEDVETITDVYSRAGARTVTISELGISEFEARKSPQINSLSDLRKALTTYSDISDDRRRTILGSFYEWDYLMFANVEMLALAIVIYIKYNGQMNRQIMESAFINNSLNSYLLNANVDPEDMDPSKYVEYKADLVKYWDAVDNFKKNVKEF